MRFLSKFTFGLVLISCGSLTSARSAFAQYEPRDNTISVSGDAQINVVPDKVSITLGVETVNASLDAAKSANDASCSRILAVAQNFKIAPKDVQTDYVSIEPRYDREGKMTILGYTVRKSMVVTLRDVSRFDALLSDAVDSGANVVLGVQFLTSDLRKYRDQARVLAIKAAKEKADALAGALGQKAGKALTINEQQSNSWSSYNSGWGRSGSNMQSQNVLQNAPDGPSDTGAGDATAPGETQVRAAVQVVFQLTD
jgi:hypothetical protein